MNSANPQTITADIAQPGLQEYMGSKNISLRFDSGGWKTASFKRDKVTVYLEGTITSAAGLKVFTPLLVKFPYGKGVVIYTSFHNAAQGDTATKLLRYLVFAVVTSQTETRIATTMGRKQPTIADDAASALEAHTWPGNVRELKNVVERAVVLARTERIAASDLHIEEYERRARRDTRRRWRSR